MFGGSSDFMPLPEEILDKILEDVDIEQARLSDERIIEQRRIDALLTGIDDLHLPIESLELQLEQHDIAVNQKRAAFASLEAKYLQQAQQEENAIRQELAEKRNQQSMMQTELLSRL
jgi:hypothetical protein